MRVLKPSSAACLCSSCHRYHCHAWAGSAHQTSQGCLQGQAAPFWQQLRDNPLPQSSSHGLREGSLLPRRRQRPAATMPWRLGRRDPGADSQPTLILAVGNAQCSRSKATAEAHSMLHAESLARHPCGALPNPTPQGTPRTGWRTLQAARPATNREPASAGRPTPLQPA